MGRQAGKEGDKKVSWQVGRSAGRQGRREASR